MVCLKRDSVDQSLSRWWPALLSIVFLWFLGFMLRVASGHFESVTLSHVASMALFTPFVALCVLAGWPPNPARFCLSMYVSGGSVAALCFLVWNAIMLDGANVLLTDRWSAIQSNAIHWCTYFCCVVMILRCMQLFLPFGISRPGVEAMRHRLSVQDLLDATWITAILLALLCIAFRTSLRPTSLSSIATAVRGAFLFSVLFTAIVFAGQSRKNRVIWIALLLVVASMVRCISPWLDIQIVHALGRGSLEGRIDDWLMHSNPKQPFSACFVEAIAQIGCMIMIIEVFQGLGWKVYSRGK